VSGSRTALAPDNRMHAADEMLLEAGKGRPFRAARRHSALVRALKIAIPFGSVLAVAAVTFVSVYNPFARIPGMTVGPISVSGSKIAMESPRLTGFRKDKRPYEVTATAAFQDIRKPNVIELKEMRARLAMDDSGAMANLVSKVGVFDTSKDHLDLTNDVRVWTDKGDEILLKSASIDLKVGTVISREPIRVTTSTMVLEAEGLDLSDGGKTMSFTGRVRAKLMRGVGAPPSTDPLVPGVAVRTPAKISQAEAGERP